LDLCLKLLTLERKGVERTDTHAVSQRDGPGQPSARKPNDLTERCPLLKSEM
jgi:hypothetical protein